MRVRAVLPRVALGLVIAAPAFWLFLNRESPDPALIQSVASHVGPWAPVAYIVIFVAATLLFVPGAVFGLAGGALFGPFLGAALNLAGATLGATAAFLVGRYLAGDRIRRLAGPRLDGLISGVEAEGWRFVAFVRLVPVFPFNLSNYAFGLTRIPLKHYVVPSLICMVPGTIAFTWLGYAGREALAGDETAIRYALLGLGLLAAIAFLPKLLRGMRGGPAHSWIEIDELSRLQASGGATVIDVRALDEFMGPLGHIAEAINLPLNELDAHLAELEKLKDERIVMVCRTDKRSASAASRLRLAGFRNVSVLRGGMELWNAKSLPVEGRLQLQRGVA